MSNSYTLNLSYCRNITDISSLGNVNILDITGCDNIKSDSFFKLALYKKSIKQYEEMEKYYKMAIEKGHISSMYNLACYYDSIKIYDKMEKYYKMASDALHVSAMFNLAIYYDEIKNYIEMEKYYKMAVENGCNDSKNNLEFYYDSIKEDNSKNSRKKWTLGEEKKLLKLYNDNLDIIEISKIHKRTIGSIKARLTKIKSNM